MNKRVFLPSLKTISFSNMETSDEEDLFSNFEMREDQLQNSLILIYAAHTENIDECLQYLKENRGKHRIQKIHHYGSLNNSDLSYVIGEDVFDNAVYVAFSRVKKLDFWTNKSGFLDWVNNNLPMNVISDMIKRYVCMT